MSVKPLKFLLGCVVLATLATATYAEKINTAQVISRTASAFFSCADYSVVGLCFWLRCGWSGCRVRTSLKVSNYAPDLTVQTYREAEDPPWTETKQLMSAMQADHDGSLTRTLLSALDSPLSALGGGGGSENKAASHSNMTFTLTDAWGNPLMFATRAISSLGFVCDPRLTPMYPYYLSNLDTVAWRFGIPEMLYPQSLSPVGWELGSPQDNWGPYYPRIGHVTHHDVLKESGLIAFRSVHFITRRHQPHVYTSTDQGSGGRGWWPPGPLEENAGKWQQISPYAEDTCHYLPMSTASLPFDGRSAYRSDDGNHVWNFWRKYTCCQKRGNWIGDINWSR